MLADLDAYMGPAAGIATSMLWTATALFFTAAGRRIGPTIVNGSRIAVAIVLLGITHRLLSGHWIPQASAGQPYSRVEPEQQVHDCLGRVGDRIAPLDMGQLVQQDVTHAPAIRVAQ